MASMRGKDAKMKEQLKRFDAVFKKPENQECFECTSKQPRWASTNLGVLFCLRCAGVHRGLGVHITKVKSTKMDLWEEDMIKTVEKIGNGNGKLLYEAKLPSSFVKPTENTDTKEIERILIQKYDKKKWAAEDFEVVKESLMSVPTPTITQTPLAGASPLAAFGTVPGGQTMSQNSNTSAVKPSPSSGAMPDFSGLSVQQQKPATATHNDWGDFATGSPSTAPATTTATTSTKPASGGDFWSDFQQSPTTVTPNNTPQVPPTNGSAFTPTTAGGGPSLMDFGAPSSSTTTATRSNDTASIMDAFKQAPPIGSGGGGLMGYNNGQQQQQQATSWGAAQTSIPQQQKPQPSPTSNNDWGSYSQSPATPATPFASPAGASPSLMDFGSPSTTTANTAASKPGGEYQRSSNTQSIMDMFSAVPQHPGQQQRAAVSPAMTGYGGHTTPQTATPPNAIWGPGASPQQQAPPPQQQQLASFF